MYSGELISDLTKMVERRSAPRLCQRSRGCALTPGHKGLCSAYAPDCRECILLSSATHLGSRNCRSGSIASGGTRAHCTCSICF